MGVDIFMHSVRLVLNDWRTALKITGLLYLIYAIPSFVLGLLFPPPAQPEQAAAAALASLPVTLLTIILATVAFVWIAVAWHRYVLLDEVPAGQLPAFQGDRMLSYFLRSLLIGLIVFGIALVMGIAIFIFAFLGPLVFVVSVAFFVLMLIASYRLSPMLPAAALGQRMTVSEAWASTAGANGAIIVLAIVSVIAAIVINLPAVLFAFLGPVGTFLSLLWSLATGWVIMLVGVSIVTTLYGHYVERRSIPAASVGVGS